MGRHALDGRPTPVSPLWHCESAWLSVRGECGHAVVAPVRAFARRAARPISPSTELYRLVDRLRCSRCATRPPQHVSVRWDRE